MTTVRSRGRKALSQSASSPRHAATSLNQSRPLVTLLTDFGISDHFVAVMKGVILGRNPRINIVDITHEVSSQDIASAAFLLLASYEHFPTDTVHVAVVDPGVGSKRRAIVVNAAKQFFVGPDNGIFSYICDRHRATVYAITSNQFFNQPVSATFHGRDVFAPVAAALASGTTPSSLGPAIDDWVRLSPLQPSHDARGTIHGRVLHIDHFGNCITSLTDMEVPDLAKASLRLKQNQITSARRFFAEPGKRNEPFFYMGSAGFIEIAIRNGSAASVLKIKTGDLVTAKLRK